jgi:hypothetical protein
MSKKSRLIFALIVSFVFILSLTNLSSASTGQECYAKGGHQGLLSVEYGTSFLGKSYGFEGTYELTPTVINGNSIILGVNGETEEVELGETVMISGLEFTYSSLNDDDSNIKGGETAKYCAVETKEAILRNSCFGCVDVKNLVCLPVGIRVTSDYCDSDKIIKSQKVGKEICLNNFECESNLCGEGNVCSEIEKEVAQVKDDVVQVKDEVKEVKGDVVQVKDDVVQVKDEVKEVKGDVVQVKDDVVQVKDEVKEVKGILAKVVDFLKNTFGFGN